MARHRCARGPSRADRLEAQRGVALPVAMTVLVLVTMAMALTFAGSQFLHRSTTRDADAQRALAAAQTGLATAAYRLDRVRPAAGQCLTVVAVAPAGGECPGQTESAGPRATFTYYVTPQLGSAGQCALLPGQTAQATDRCVTASGASDDVTRRLQVRLKPGGAPLFASVGVLGVDEIQLAGNSSATGSSSAVSLGSNGTIELTGNSASVTGTAEVGPGGTIDDPQDKIPAANERVRSTPWELPRPDQDFADARYANANAAIATASGTNVSWDPADRVLKISGGGYLDLPSGIYNLCELSVGELRLALGVQVRIYIDSPDRPGSGCKSGSGTLEIKGSVNAPATASTSELQARAPNLQIFVYGSSDKRDVEIDANGTVAALIQAPGSNVRLRGNSTVVGSLQADVVDINGAARVERPASADTVTSVSRGERLAWAECKAQPATAGDPESGC